MTSLPAAGARLRSQTRADFHKKAAMTSMNAQSVAEILTTTLSGLLAVGLAAATAVSALGQAHGTWTSTGAMHTARFLHTATQLNNGQHLAAGDVTLSSAALYAVAQ